MQHLVGAKLEMLYPDHDFDHHGYSVADAPTGRVGDFDFGESSIHVTNSPSTALMQKCRDNLDQGVNPLIISSTKGAAFAEEMASSLGLDKRIEVLDIEQFLVTNLLEWSSFSASQRKGHFSVLVDHYNRIVGDCETDPSLKIELT